MNGRAVKWGIAIAASAAVHAGAVIWVGAGNESVEVAGGAQAEIAVLGSAFQDSLAGGDTSETVEPSKTEAEAVPPVEADPARQAITDPVQPARDAAEPAETAVETPSEPVTAPQTARTEAEAVEPRSQDITIAALQPAEAQREGPAPLTARENVAVEPVEEPDAPVTPETAPRPTPRPEQTAEASEPPTQRRVRETPEEPEKTPAKPRRQAGSGGNAEQSARRGSADGSKQAQKTEAGDSGRSREAGNAAVSNYPGKVYAKLRRSLRYPAEARRKRIRGEVHVRFTVSRSGGVGSVQLARSSGSPVLDSAALETVRRAAPFPEIPAAAGRSSWSFTVPLAFTR